MDKESHNNAQLARSILEEIMPDRARMRDYDRNLVEDLAYKLHTYGDNAQLTERQLIRLRMIKEDLHTSDTPSS